MSEQPQTFEDFKTELSSKVPNYHEGIAMMRTYMFRKEVLHPLTRMTTEELDQKQIQKPFRDQCVHHYVPLRDCRSANNYWPTACEQEKIRYERCIFKFQLKLKERSQRLIEMEKKLNSIDKIIREKKKSENTQ